MANKPAKSKPVWGAQARAPQQTPRANSPAALGPSLVYSPRATRSISALTRRSTMTGRLSSSQALSIGRSISRVRPTMTSLCWTNRLARSVLKDARTELSGPFEASVRPAPGQRARRHLAERQLSKYSCHLRTSSSSLSATSRPICRISAAPIPRLQSRRKGVSQNFE